MHRKMKKWSVHLVIGEQYVGELEAEVARQSMFTSEFQRLERMEYSEEAMDLLYSLMGEDVAPRRDFIFENIDFSQVRE